MAPAAHLQGRLQIGTHATNRGAQGGAALPHAVGQVQHPGDCDSELDVGGYRDILFMCCIYVIYITFCLSAKRIYMVPYMWLDQEVPSISEA